MANTVKRKTASARKAPGKNTIDSPPPVAEPAAISTLARQLRSWTDSVLGLAGVAADASVLVAKTMMKQPRQKAALEKTGAFLRDVREAAGLSVNDVAEAINLKDTSLLELVESGKVAVPFDVILRLASVLGRNDPVSFIMRVTRTNAPDIWKTLENLGVGKLALQVGRERELANIYRSYDAARVLSDAEFADVLAFTDAAFKMALAFHEPNRKPSAKSTSTRRNKETAD